MAPPFYLRSFLQIIVYLSIPFAIQGISMKQPTTMKDMLFYF